MLETIRRQAGRYPKWTLALVTVGALLPFLGKPFNMDDPLFVWAAHQIHAHPANPYGFNVEWDWRQAPMWKATENPPLTCYYIALASAILGWSEVALHFAFLLPALTVILGTFRLAGRFCHSPTLAALITLFTPAFLVSSTTLMSDVPMLAFWVWALVFWVEGTEENNLHKLFAAGCLVSFAEITKYYAISLIPLLVAYSIMSRRPPGKWAQFLVIPLGVFWAYQLAIEHLYGLCPLLRAATYSFDKEGDFLVVHSTACLVGLAFTGGCLAPALFLMPLLWKKWAAAFLAIAILIASLLFCYPASLNGFPCLEPISHPGIEIQLALWAATGTSVLVLILLEMRASRDPKSLLLVLWMAGTFIFAVFLNWTINARSILPMAPALGILIARRLERNSTATFPTGLSGRVGAVVCTTAPLS